MTIRKNMTNPQAQPVRDTVVSPRRGLHLVQPPAEPAVRTRSQSTRSAGLWTLGLTALALPLAWAMHEVLQHFHLF